MKNIFPCKGLNEKYLQSQRNEFAVHDNAQAILSKIVSAREQDEGQISFHSYD